MVSIRSDFPLFLRQTQWDPPTWEGSSDNTSVDHESEMDLGTPTYDENPSKVRFTAVMVYMFIAMHQRKI